MAKKSLSKKLKAMIALVAVVSLLAPTGFSPKSSNVANAAVAQQYKNVMYYGDWSIWAGQSNFYPKDIPAEDLTHLNFAFMDFDADGTLRWCDDEATLKNGLTEPGTTYDSPNSGLVTGFQMLKLRNPNLKIGVSLGGWSKSGDFSSVSASSAARAKFVQNTMDFVKYMNMDFVDIDWEYPGADQYRDPDKVDNKNDEGTTKANAADKQNYILLLQDLRNGLNKLEAEYASKGITKKFELSAALPASGAKVTDGIDVKKMFEILDYGNLMTYDMAGAWSTTTGHQTALYSNPNTPAEYKGLSVDECVKNYMAQGAPASKLTVGAAFYTRGWEKVTGAGPDANNPGLFGTAAKVNLDKDNMTQTPGAINEGVMEMGSNGRMGGVWSYRSLDELKSKYPGLKEYWDDTAKAPYLYNPSTGAFFTYDNPRSIQEKVNYVKANKLGGVISWMASQDKATTGTKRDELTKVIRNGLYGTAALPAVQGQYLPVSVDAKYTLSTAQWGGGSNLNITIKNNETIKSSDPVVKAIEERYKTVKLGKLYIKTKGVKITGGDYPATGGRQEGDYYVFELTGYETQFFKPGQSITLPFKIAETNVSGEVVERIEVSQRFTTTTQEFNRQTIYGPQPDPVITLADVAARYNAKTGDVLYDVKYDFNKDGIIDIYDLVYVARKM